MREFDYLEPTSVQEASRMLADLGDEARLMAGGTALMLAMRQRMLVPTHIVSAARIEALRGIRWDATEGLRIGALSRHIDIARSELVQRHVPMLADMAARLANPQVRHQGTLGGNLCYGDPSTDPPGCLMALGAQLVLANHRGERVLPVEEFLVDFFETALGPDELVLEVRVPPLSEDATGHYTRFRRTAAEHRPLVNVSVLARHEGRLCRQARIVVGASVPVPQRVREAEALLEGAMVTPRLAEDVAARVAEAIEPIDDLRGSQEFRREMVRVNTQRTLEQVFGLAVAPIEGETR
ncbi:FAD binding domain-containing protein [Ramlibacter rhizophilus]|uniref:Xanthine dehydrogenase family protein subunit M n=1 Tax=Ramlibacter rhizophilus TaxID=1781167 RepID=A0A4Z0BG40_9BURK|nr:xanthine dehydrogenase family protein subunit M [Ramlibacter rhizophilus]TFY97257.1 xanthine dehydrogenase family protein subunit M [Ramlibacter rhizophilus]